ncbi:hypothetical protein BFL28_13140 [Sphingomonas turrisvirgatae]|uniref:Uncharacterized protein n=1 Tax=Sphingomonas turrisvirgatae TaxID=1888892 RepID=A0A1E3LYF1_9SPHN|nr:hypothetical protein BFL28_13140 [Sphingomonas turrisvirgatae]
MQPTSTLCRAQEARHHALASAAVLDNVRQVATTAAAAWAKEGVAAALREGRKLRASAAAAAHAALAEPPHDEFRALSENPDRGHADAA